MTTSKTLDLLGLGVCTLDMLALVEQFPRGDDVQRAAATTLQGGGPVATALCTASRLGCRTQMLDCLGDDWRGDLICRELQDFGVETSSIPQIPGETSSMASIWVRKQDGSRAIAYAPGSAPELEPPDLPEATIASAKILHCNGRHEAAMFEAARLARTHDTLVSFDGGANRFRESLRPFLSLVDIAIVAQDFAIRASGQTNLQKAGAHLLEQGAQIAAITCGRDGSWIFPADGAPFHQPACLLEDTVDTTGCGDVYHGAFLAGLVQELPLEACARRASAAAAINSRALGGRGHLPTEAELLKFLGN